MGIHLTKKGKKKKTSGLNTSSIAQHKKVGSSLIPPIMQVPGISFLSWMNDRLPECLWLCLIITNLPRPEGLEIFKGIAALGQAYRNTTAAHNNEIGIGISQLVNAPDHLFDGIINIIRSHSIGLKVLRPLLLLDSLPGKERWAAALNTTPEPDDWGSLAKAVAKTLDHQSHESTDIRWLIIMFNAALGKISVMRNMAHIVDELFAYPNYNHDDDVMRRIRPSIRSMEMVFPITDEMLQRNTQSQWAKQFWDETLKKTECITNSKATPTVYNDSLSEERFLHVVNAYIELTEHFFTIMRSSAVTIKLDIIFGFGLYSLALLSEIITGYTNDTGLAGRLILKSLVDCRVTLAYLLKKDDLSLYEKFRGFGTGQAKLALLKIQEIEGSIPSFITEDILNFLANEDIYQEYVTIELGNWYKEDLRTMSINSETKEDYDKYYGWASGYSHAQWSAMRDSCFTTCFNPLHKVHRIPLSTMHRPLERVLPDAVEITNKILLSITGIFPGADITLDTNIFLNTEANLKQCD